jgi:integral membrane protein (TIGR00529 family)
MKIMSDIIKLLIVLSLIVLLLRWKYKIGIVLLSASALLSILYLMPPKEIILNISDAVSNTITIKLGISLVMIRVLELILRENNILAEMMEASKSLFRNRKLVIVSMPMLIGILPSLGGAYFSAPMVNESTKNLKMSQEEKGFVNFWFRHPWEYILPLYPGLLLASSISDVELRTLILINLPYAVTMLLTGFLFSMREVKGNVEYVSVSRKGLYSFIPIGLIILLVMILKVELHLSLIILVIGLLIFYRYGAINILKALKYGFALDVILLVFGVMLFKELMEGTGAVRNLGEFFISKGIPIMPLLFILPFISGFLTGITVGSIGSTFPLLLHMLHGSPLGAVSFAFASAYLGVLLSPVHICLILTREYFKADMWMLYKKILLSCAAIFLVAVIEYLVL